MNLHWLQSILPLLCSAIILLTCTTCPSRALAQIGPYSRDYGAPKIAKKSPAIQLPARFRRPAALALSADEKWLYTANRRSGGVSVVDLSKQQVVAEVEIGQRLSDLIATPNPRLLLATDESAHELLLLRVMGSRITVAQRLQVSSYPVSVVVSADGKRCFIASLWSRRLTFVDLPDKENDQARVTGKFDMPFAPRRQLLVRDDTRLIVADSFGGKLGVVDTASGKLVLTRDVPGHNIRGLALSRNGTMLLVSHQMLNELAHTVRNDVHWGLLMSNDLRWLRLEAVLTPEADLYKGAHMHPLGEAGSATADPGGLAVASDGTVVVTLSGVGEVSLGAESDFSLFRLRVGKRPTAVVITRDSRWAYTINRFDDSISVVDLQQRHTVADISLGPTPPLTSADAGELLFHDARLSHDGWMTCQSCHTDGHTNSMLNDNFSDASFGAPKRVLSLLGKADTAPFAWTGSAKSFEEQIRKSIFNTMQSDQDPSEKQIGQLADYLATLTSPPSIDLARDCVDQQAILRGEKLFQSQRCARCHAPPTYTTPKTYDVGLEDKIGNQRFNPPSLRGVGQRSPYFHDGRAKTLDDVLIKFRHKLSRDVTDEERADLKAFLRSL